MPHGHADSRCLSCGQLCTAPASGELFRCGRCWTVLQAGMCPEGHSIAWPVKNPQAMCIYCSGKAPVAETQRTRTKMVGAHRRLSR